jgi:uncharacterized repeat protein (TIGR01451 family)
MGGARRLVGGGLVGRARAAIGGLVVVLALVIAPAAQASAPGQLTQLGSPFGCLTSDPSLVACTQLSDNSFTEPVDVAVSPDGLNAYAADYVNDSVDVFARDPATGALTALADPAGAGLFGASAVAVSPDGQNVYVASEGDGTGHDGAIDEFSRNSSTGALTEIGCISDVDTISGCSTVTDATGIGDPVSIAISPDGTTVYVVGQYDEAVAAFSRAPGGLLTQLSSPYDCVTSEGSGCGTVSAPGLLNAQSVTVSPDGDTVYVAAGGGVSAGDIDAFDRDEDTGELTQLTTGASGQGCLSTTPLTNCNADLTGLDGAAGLAVSPDATSVYVTSESNDSLLEFSRDPGSGDLTQLSTPNNCITTQPSGCGTVNAHGFVDPQDVAVSPDGATVYVTGLGDSAVAEFSRTPATSALTQLASPADCITSNASGCGTTSADALTAPGSLVVSPDNGDVYVASTDGGSSAIVALGRAPVAPPSGALSQLLEPSNCVGVVGGLAADVGHSVPYGSVGCDTLLSTPSDDNENSVDLAISPDGRNAYGVYYDNELAEFSRNPASGALTYLGCITQASGCDVNGAPGMNGPAAVAVSPDGQNVYVAGNSDNAVAEFSRNPGTGLLTQLTGSGACISESGSSSSCSNQTGYGLDGASGIVVSSDGQNVYVAGAGDDAIAELQRNPSTGALSPVPSPNACISDGTVITPSECTNTAVGLGVNDPNTQTEADLAISPDGENVYVSAGGFSGNGDVAEFSRNTDSGVLSQLAGDNACVTSEDSDTGCPANNATNVNGPDQIAVSPDGKNVYVASVDTSGILEFKRVTGGALSQLTGANGCIGGSCSPSNPASGLTIDPGVAISPDGLNVYGTGADDNAIGVLDRAPATGILTQPAFPYNCLSSLYGYNPSAPYYYPSGCGAEDSAGFAGGLRVTVSPDGIDVYDEAQTLPAIVELARETPAAHVTLGEAGAPASGTVGGQITYTYTVQNSGPNASDDPVLTVPLASELLLVSASPSQGTCYGTATVTCNLDVLADGSSATVALTVALAQAGTASQPASVGYVNDPSDADHSVTTTTTIAAPAAPPPPPVMAPLAGPVLEDSTDVTPVTGTVEVELPGTTTFVPLSQAENIPMGATINATGGTVQITTALPNGTTQTGDFYDGEFVVTQNSSGRVFATLAGGSYAGCPPAHSSSKGGGKHHHKKGALLLAATKKSKSTVVRQLWGNAHGDYTTKGRYGSAAVSGTIWLTQDRCDGTYFKVTKDTIVVTANAHPSKHHNLKQGQSLLVPAPGF